MRTLPSSPPQITSEELEFQHYLFTCFHFLKRYIPNSVRSLHWNMVLERCLHVFIFQLFFLTLEKHLKNLCKAKWLAYSSGKTKAVAKNETAVANQSNLV